MAKPRSAGMSGVAVSMIGVGALAIYSAIKGTSPLEELRSILTGKRPDPLSADPKAKQMEPFSGGTIPNVGKGSGAKLSSTGQVQPHVLAEMHYTSTTWGIETQGFSFRNIAGTNTLSDHAFGLAFDAMVGTSASGKTIGDAIYAHYVSNASAKHVKYVIWQHDIWTPGQGAHRYAKSDHLNHVHISFLPLIKGRVGR